MSGVIITGGAMGLGRAVAEEQISRGIKVGLIDRDLATVQATAEEIGAAFAAADVTKPEELVSAMASLADTLGEVRGLVNSAGITRPGPSHSLPIDDWKTVIDIDLSGTFYACQAVYPHLARGSSIVNIASIMATRMLPGRAAYSAAKAGVVGLTRLLAVEWAPQGIRVNAVGPAWVQTALVLELFEKGLLDKAELEAKMPAGHLPTPVDVARTVSYLLDDQASSFVSGQTIYVDSGYLFAG